MQLAAAPRFLYVANTIFNPRLCARTHPASSPIDLRQSRAHAHGSRLRCCDAQPPSAHTCACANSVLVAHARAGRCVGRHYVTIFMVAYLAEARIPFCQLAADVT